MLCLGESEEVWICDASTRLSTGFQLSSSNYLGGCVTIKEAVESNREKEV